MSRRLRTVKHLAVPGHIDSIMFDQEEQLKEKEKPVCPRCFKSIAQTASLTGWIFRSDSCQCRALKTSEQAPITLVAAETAITSEQAKELGLTPNYEPLSVIGRGGMGCVYKVRDKILEKTFAAKVVRPEFALDQSAVERFFQEATAAGELTHPNLAAVFKHGFTEHDAPYILMEYLEGENLAARLRRTGPLEPGYALAVFMQICDGLAHAHMKNIVHRDIKPANIMLVNDAHGGETVKILDFGIAKLMYKNEHENLTQTGEILGSTNYMSPEQALGEYVDQRSDIYSLGCLMFESLTGELPFQAANPVKIILEHLSSKRDKQARLLFEQRLPEGLTSVVLHCLEREPGRRYQLIEHLEHDLRRLFEGKLPELPGKLDAPAQKAFALSKTRAAIVVLSLSLTAILVASILIVLWRPHSARPVTYKPAFYSQNLQPFANAGIGWLQMPPSGTRVFGGVPFQIESGPKSIVSIGDTGLPRQLSIPVDVKNVHAVHILINGSYIVKVAAGVRLGYVNLHYKDGATQSVPLIAWENVRETWRSLDRPANFNRFDPGVPLAEEVFSEKQLRGNNQRSEAYLDELTIPCLSDHGQLTGITIECALDVTGARHSSLHITAVTLESESDAATK